MKQLPKNVIDALKYHNIKQDDCGDYRLECHDSECDELEEQMISLLPRGWEFRWSGDSNTDADGDTTEDALIVWLGDNA